MAKVRGIASNFMQLKALIHEPHQSVQAVAATIAATAVGIAIHLHDGEYTPKALALISVALIAAIWQPGWLTRFLPDGNKTVLILGSALAIQLGLLVRTWPAGEDQVIVHRANHLVFAGLLLIAAALVFIGLLDFTPIRRWWFPALLGVHAAMGVWMIRSSPNPHIDVWVFQQMAPDALMHGHNPYVADQVNFPDIYHSTRLGAQEVYGPGMSKEDVLQFGFPYPPISLLLSTLGYALAGDHRYAQAIAITLGGLFIGYARPGRVAMLSACVLLFTPRVFFIIGRAWTEPFVVMLLALTLFLACRKSRLLPIALGLFLASKQYLIFAVPLTFLLLPEAFDWRSKSSWMRWLRLLVYAGVAAAVVTLPLALWNWRQFWFSTITVQQKAPFRWDALSYLVFLALHDRRFTNWSWLPFVAVIAALVWTIRKSPKNAAGFASSLGLVFLAFFAFNKQAFCNYYFFTIAAFCCAAAVSRHSDNSDDVPT